MAYGVIHRFAGGTEDQYRASIAAVHPSDGSLPDGQVFHVAGPSDDGWVIVAIHESRESWENFRDGTLMPQLHAGVEGGFQEPPQETSFEVANQQSG
jgi:heme-degrading monooxygenase HmoA